MITRLATVCLIGEITGLFVFNVAFLVLLWLLAGQIDRPWAYVSLGIAMMLFPVQLLILLFCHFSKHPVSAKGPGKARPLNA